MSQNGQQVPYSTAPFPHTVVAVLPIACQFHAVAMSQGMVLISPSLLSISSLVQTLGPSFGTWIRPDSSYICWTCKTCLLNPKHAYPAPCWKLLIDPNHMVYAWIPLFPIPASLTIDTFIIPVSHNKIIKVIFGFLLFSCSSHFNLSRDIGSQHYRLTSTLTYSAEMYWRPTEFLQFLAKDPNNIMRKYKINSNLSNMLQNTWLLLIESAQPCDEEILSIRVHRLAETKGAWPLKSVWDPGRETDTREVHWGKTRNKENNMS